VSKPNPNLAALDFRPLSADGSGWSFCHRRLGAAPLLHQLMKNHDCSEPANGGFPDNHSAKGKAAKPKPTERLNADRLEVTYTDPFVAYVCASDAVRQMLKKFPADRRAQALLDAPQDFADLIDEDLQRLSQPRWGIGSKTPTNPKKGTGHITTIESSPHGDTTLVTPCL
jgi:hypothetical protein